MAVPRAASSVWEQGWQRSAQYVSSGLRIAGAITAIAAASYLGSAHLKANVTASGFGLLCLVLLIGAYVGLKEAVAASITATVAYNYFFLPPVRTFTISDPQNWVALFGFLLTALVASQLSTQARQRGRQVFDRQRDLESLYAFSRALLLLDRGSPIAKQLVTHLADLFKFDAVALCVSGSGEITVGGPLDFEAPGNLLRESLGSGASIRLPARRPGGADGEISAVVLGSQPIASLGTEGHALSGSVRQALLNLVAIGLERARVEELATQMEAVRRSDQLRSTLLDAAAHEFKTPLTAIKAATTALLDEGLLSDKCSGAIEAEMLRVADEEADHLLNLVDESIDMARLAHSTFTLDLEAVNLRECVQQTIKRLGRRTDGRLRMVESSEPPIVLSLDRRLMRLALRQVFENALIHSPSDASVEIRVERAGETIRVSVVDHGPGISEVDVPGIFDRFYRGTSARNIAGSGLGLHIARTIARAHGGDLELVANSSTGATFRFALPVSQDDGGKPLPETLGSRTGGSR